MAQLVPLLLGIILAGACTRCSGTTEVRVVEYQNEGEACLVPSSVQKVHDPQEARPINANEAVGVRVVFQGCESYCAEVVSATCHATLRNDAIHVTGEAKLREELAEDEGCPTACLVVDARCPLDTLPAGDYTITYGETSREIEVPGSDSCAGD